MLLGTHSSVRHQANSACKVPKHICKNRGTAHLWLICIIQNSNVQNSNCFSGSVALTMNACKNVSLPSVLSSHTPKHIRNNARLACMYLSIGCKVIKQFLIVLSNGGVGYHPQGVLPNRQVLLHLIQLCLEACQVGKQTCNTQKISIVFCGVCVCGAPQTLVPPGQGSVLQTNPFRLSDTVLLVDIWVRSASRLATCK